jgi:hypothetical protein
VVWSLVGIVNRRREKASCFRNAGKYVPMIPNVPAVPVVDRTTIGTIGKFGTAGTT